jgi:hypothetical protein
MLARSLRCRRGVTSRAREHVSIVQTGDDHRAEEKPHPESAAAIPAKNRFWRAAMRRKAGEHENFFIAKNCDSESARRAFDRYRESRRQ